MQKKKKKKTENYESPDDSAKTWFSVYLMVEFLCCIDLS